MDEDIHIPSTANLIRITNVIDPFHLRIYDTKNYSAKIVKIQKNLHHIAKNKLQEYTADSPPQIGDLVFIDNRSSFNVDLPAWYCRGIIGSDKRVNSKYRVFLPDHGIALEFWIEDLKILPPSSISDAFLTSSIGIHNLLPVNLENGITCVSAKWNRSAIKFTREIISAATRTFFDYISCDKFGNKFGEVYLILEGHIVLLSDALVCNYYATFINRDLMKMINERNSISPQPSSETEGIASDSHKSVQKYSSHNGNLDNRSSDESDDDKGRKKSTAVYTRAFNRSVKKRIAENSNHEILIWSKIQCEELTSLTEARFPFKIHKVLRHLALKRLMRLQGYVWPAITKGLNVVAVASQRSGKTTSYLVPVIGSIAANESYAKIPGVNGPLALILCVCSSEVYDIYDKCKELLQHYPKVKVLSAYNGISEKSVVANIYNGCEILITTPPYLTRLIKNDRNLLKFDRLSHMVFDGADVIIEKYRNWLGEILKIPTTVKNGHRESPLQMIAVARHWTPSLKRFVDVFIKDPYVCIGSYMEAAVFAALKPKLIFLPKNHKAAKVVELLNVRWTMMKTMIVCTTTKEATELVDVLKSNSMDTLIVHDQTIFTDILGVKETWMTRVSGKYFVLVCTDQVLSDLNVRDAELLIHYSLGSSTKSQFFYRFSTLTDNFSHRVRGREKPKPSFILLADESNDAQLNGIITIMRRLEQKIPPAMEAYLEKILISAEKAKTDRCLCESIKAFGRCRERDSCPSRHIFSPEIDQPMTKIRSGDWVKLVLTGRHRRSANHYSARVVEFTKGNTGEVVPFSFQEFADLAVKMQKHYSNPERRRSSRAINVGDVCSIEEAPGNYKRVKVLSGVDKEAVNIQHVDVRCIDDGEVFSIKACQLLEIPEDLARWPSHIVDIYLTGLIPFDDEPNWSPCTDDIVEEWFENNLAQSSYVYGKVLLHLSHILWVDPLEIRHKLLDGYPDLVDSSLKTTLIEAKCAMENKEHIKTLLDICRDGNISEELFANVDKISASQEDEIE